MRDELIVGHGIFPDWLRVEAVKRPDEVIRMLQIVDEVEAEAIELAKELCADRLLIDERKGRRLAYVEGGPVIGLVGVVLLAKRKGLILSARNSLDQIEDEAGMYLAEDNREEALRSVRE